MLSTILILVVVLIIGVLIISSIKKNKEKPVVVEDIDEGEEEIEETGSDKDLANLRVYYHGKMIENRETVIEKGDESKFKVKGFDIKDKGVILNPNKLSWRSSCRVVHFSRSYGLSNSATCSIKGDLERNVWVKYTNAVVFAWKIQFIKGG